MLRHTFSSTLKQSHVVSLLRHNVRMLSSSAPSTIPATMQASRIHKADHPFENFTVDTIDTPNPGPGEALVKIKATAVNPLDIKLAAGWLPFIKVFPTTLGEDMSGVVAAVGEGVNDLKVGDAVFTATINGTFAEYISTPASWLTPKPADWSFSKAAAAGMGILTAANALFLSLKTATPSNPTTVPEKVLIWGAGGPVGTMATQLATLSGYEVVAVAGKDSEALLKECGAKWVCDHRDPDVAAKVGEIVGEELRYALDLVGTKTIPVVVSLLRKNGDAFLTETAGPPNGPLAANVKFDFINTNEVLLDSAKGKVVFGEVRPLIAEGKLRVVDVMEVEGGIEGVKIAVQTLFEGKNAGRKVVVHMS